LSIGYAKIKNRKIYKGECTSEKIMKIITKILLGSGGILFIVDGIIKIASLNITIIGLNIMGMSMPCGITMIIIGLGLLALVLEKKK
jgi:hypothetical protein